MIALLPREQDASSIVVVFVVMTAIYSVFGVIAGKTEASTAAEQVNAFFQQFIAAIPIPAAAALACTATASATQPTFCCRHRGRSL